MITVYHIIRAAQHRFHSGQYDCWVDALNSVCRDVGPDSLVARQARRLCARHNTPGVTSEHVFTAALKEVAPAKARPGSRVGESNPDVPFEL